MVKVISVNGKIPLVDGKAIKATEVTAPTASAYDVQSVDNGDGTQTIEIADSTGTITDGIIVKARDADGFPTEIDIYGSNGKYYGEARGYSIRNNQATYFYKLNKINFKYAVTKIYDGAFSGLTSLNEITGIKANPFEDVTDLGNWNTFNDCTLPGELYFPDLTMCGVYSFYQMPNITKISCPKLTYAHQFFAYNCASLKEIYLPSCERVNGDSRYALGNNTALEKLQLGSVGHKFLSFNRVALTGCTQSFLVITVYTSGDLADTLLSNIRNGATNATIILKAAEDTTYNDTQFAAGETIITSTVEVSA